MFIVCMLPEEGDSTLSIIDIELRHVKIIDKVDKFLLSRRTELLTCDFLQELFELNLEIGGVSVVREVNELIIETIGKLLHNGPETSFSQSCLTTPSQTDQKNRMIHKDKLLYEEFSSDTFLGWNGNITHDVSPGSVEVYSL